MQRDDQKRQPMWLTHRRDRSEAPRTHRPVHNRHGFVFGFPNCTAAELDEYLDDSFND